MKPNAYKVHNKYNPYDSHSSIDSKKFSEGKCSDKSLENFESKRRFLFQERCSIDADDFLLKTATTPQADQHNKMIIFNNTKNIERSPSVHVEDTDWFWDLLKSFNCMCVNDNNIDENEDKFFEVLQKESLMSNLDTIKSLEKIPLKRVLKLKTNVFKNVKENRLSGFPGQVGDVDIKNDFNEKYNNPSMQTSIMEYKVSF